MRESYRMSYRSTKCVSYCMSYWSTKCVSYCMSYWSTKKYLLVDCTERYSKVFKGDGYYDTKFSTLSTLLSQNVHSVDGGKGRRRESQILT